MTYQAFIHYIKRLDKLIFSSKHPGTGLYHLVLLLLTYSRDIKKTCIELYKRPLRAQRCSLLWCLRLYQLLRSIIKASNHYKIIKDKRFKHPLWQQPVFFVLQQAYLQTCHCLWLLYRFNQDRAVRNNMNFITTFLTSVLSPSNLFATNPEVLQHTIKERGRNFKQGMAYLLQDLATWQGYLNFCKGDHHSLGKDLATTRGTVVFKNDVMELIHYQATNTECYNKPILLVPSWINKFYIYDLTKKQSMASWLLQQQADVYVISWVNPSHTCCDLTPKDYISDGIITALDTIFQRSHCPAINTVGHCLGGTLLLCALSLWQKNQHAYDIASVTLLATLIDFKEAGLLSSMMGDAQQHLYQKLLAKQTYWDARQLALAFNLLEPNAFIWPYWVSRYGKGKRPVNLAVLSWASDMMHCTRAMYEFYAKTLCHDNALVKKTLQVDHQYISLDDITMPTYVLAMDDDHIAPAATCLQGACHLPNVDKRMTTKGGHYTGLISPPHQGRLCSSQDNKQKKLQNSWWQHWQHWLQPHLGEIVPAVANDTGQQAPGSYVMTTLC